MVDWVVAGGARRRRRRASSSSRRPTARDSFDGVEVAVQHEPLGTGDAVRSARDALAGVGGDVLVLNGDVPAPHRRAAARARRDAPRARAPPATVLAFEPDDLALVRPHRPRRRRPARADRRGRRRVARRARARRGQLRHLRLPRREALARCSSGSSRTTRRASSTSPTRSACSSPTARPSPSTSRRRPWEVEGINTRVELAVRRRRSCATGSTRRTCSPASRSSIRRRPGSRPASRSSPT